MTTGRRLAGFLCGGLLVAALLAGAAAAEEAPARPRRAVATFEGELEALPRLAPADFEITAGKQRLLPTRLYAPAELPTLIAVVFPQTAPADPAARQAALREFIVSQAPNTYVGLFCFEGESVRTVWPFDSDLAKVSAALPSPMGAEPAPASADAGLARLLRAMEELPPARKEVLLLAEVGGAGTGSWAESTEAARQTGIPVWLIPVVPAGALPPGGPPPGPAPLEIETARADIPMSYAQATQAEEMACDFLMRNSESVQALAALTSLARRSGGKALAGGRPRVDLRPGFNEFRRLLNQQFLLEFTASEPPTKIRTLRKVAGARLLSLQR